MAESEEVMDKQNFFLGIDLGTTNSVIAFANMRNNALLPTVLSVPRTSDTGGTVTAPTLPSVVYYSKERNGRLLPKVGDFAKAQYGKKYGFVVKSVKTSMGSGIIPDISEELPDQKPEDVSARVLEQLLVGAKSKLILDDIPDDVIITIPASFDSDMRKATLDAAQSAGITAYDSQGKPRDILLYEPKAVLYDIVNSQMNGEIPDALMDLSSPKHVMIYDLGGGTLDVSMHTVSKTAGSDLLSIDDVAISRYTNIGGDDFDTLIAAKLRELFIEQYGTGLNLTEQARKEILSIFIKKAENLKIAMNTAYETLDVRGEVLPDEHDEYISEVNLYGGYPFEAYVTKKEMLSYIKPLMGENLSLDSVEQFEKLTSPAAVDNIIYPILDVLVKAKAAIGAVKPDYIILNGGMSKFFPVKERLERFFGCKPITINDPDMSVAKGAVVYHYYLHKYKVQEHVSTVVAPRADDVRIASDVRPAEGPGTRLTAFKTPGYSKPKSITVEEARIIGSPILNDTLNLAVRGGYVQPLIKAGTKLPYVSEVFDIYELPKDCDNIRLPLYNGSGSTTQSPNRKIAERILHFSRPYPAGTKISIQVEIDRYGLISLSTWVSDHPQEIGRVSVDMQQTGVTGNKVSGSKPVMPNPNFGMTVNFKAELNSLQQLFQRKKAAQNALNHQLDSKISRQIREVVERLANAKNAADGGEGIVRLLENSGSNNDLMGCLFGLGGPMYAKWPGYIQREFHRHCRNVLNIPGGWPAKLTSKHTQAINALAQIGDKEDEPLLRKLLLMRDKAFSCNASIALAKIGADPSDLLMLFHDLTRADVAKLNNYPWAIGRSCSREKGTYANLDQLKRAAEKCMDLLADIKLQNRNVQGLLLYCLGELCDCRLRVQQPLPVQVCSKAKACVEKFWHRIEFEDGYEALASRVSTVLKMVSGEDLTSQEDAELLAVRNQF